MWHEVATTQSILIAAVLSFDEQRGGVVAPPYDQLLPELVVG
jgi:hypothetical protein